MAGFLRRHKTEMRAKKHSGLVQGLMLGIPLGALGHWAWSQYAEWLVIGGLALIFVISRRKRA